MSGEEFAEWVAFSRLHPFGEERADLRNGILACEVLRPHLKKGVMIKPQDFMPDFMPKKPKSPEEIMAHFARVAKRMNNGRN